MRKRDNEVIEINGLSEDNESKVGKVISDRTTVKTIIIVLLLILSVPYFEVTNNFKVPSAININLINLQNMATSESNTLANMQSFYQAVLDQKRVLSLL